MHLRRSCTYLQHRARIKGQGVPAERPKAPPALSSRDVQLIALGTGKCSGALLSKQGAGQGVYGENLSPYAKFATDAGREASPFSTLCPSRGGRSGWRQGAELPPLRPAAGGRALTGRRRAARLSRREDGMDAREGSRAGSAPGPTAPPRGRPWHCGCSGLTCASQPGLPGEKK